jgi:hypothetical protein
MSFIDYIDSIAHHPFILILGGCVFYFILKYRVWWVQKEKSFLSDQYDDILWSLIFGMLLVIFDEEMLLVFTILSKEVFNREFTSINPDEGFKDAYYLLACPAFEFILEQTKRLKRK